MENEKKHVCACGGCKGEHHNDEVTPATPMSPGFKLAIDAVSEMKQKEAAEEKAKTESDALEISVDEFLAACSDNGQDPMAVVAHIAKREDISLSGDAPEGAEKRRIYKLLRAVVGRLVTDVSAEVAEECGFDADRLNDLVLRTLKFGHPLRSASCTKCVRVVPMRIRYAFAF